MSWSQNGTPTGGPTPVADTFTGLTPDADIEDGLGGDDVLAGEGGNDTLEGGADSDIISGGDDDDLLTDDADGGNLNGDAGDDTIAMTLDGALGANAAFAYGGAGDDSIAVTGNGLQDGLTFLGVSAIGDGGNDTIVTGASDDFIGGGDDDDSIDAGDGNDAAYGDAGNDTILGGAGNDDIYGEAGVDITLTGNDSLDGGDGDDTIHAEGGDDTIASSDGIDHAYGGDGINALDFSNAANGVEMVLGQGELWNDGYGNADYAYDFTVAYGSAHADRFFAGSGSGDSLFGQAGEDNVFGGGGDDTLSGGTDNDHVIGEEGADLLFGDDGDDTLVGGRTDINPPFAPEPEGNDPDSPDTLDGGAGQDLLLGQEGNDSLFGGTGTDTFDGGTGDDIIDGGDEVLLGEEGNIIGVLRETDLATYANASEGVSFSLTDGSGLVAGGTYGTDDLVNIEQVVGTAFDDSMEMQWGDETVGILMAGGAGHDAINFVGTGSAAGTLDGGDGNDTITGGRADDTILGGEGDDFITGGDGNDSIVATPGADTVAGGVGNDSILTGDDNDLVVWRLGDGNDTIDLGDGQDTLDLDGWSGDWTISVDGSTATFTGDGDVGGAVLTILNYDPTDSVVCFAEGTRIMTARGEVPVEALRVGDLALTAGRGPAFQPIRWVGHTPIDLKRHRARDRIAPVLVMAGALGAGVPHRDLRVSPEHGLLIDGALVAAGLLVNGTTIVQEAWRSSVTYWHVELDAHGVLVAEGALAESYLDDGNRHFFGTAIVPLDPDFGAGRIASGYAKRACAPVVKQGDPALGRIRLRLAAATARRVA